jgi:ABC-type antimicrobial peptide transport system permease subunit
LGRHIWASQTGYLADIEIVGVARDAVANSLRAVPPPKVYVPYFQMERLNATTLEVRAAGSLSQVAESLRKLVQSKFPGTPIEVRTFRSQLESTLVRERLMATLAGGFGALALVLAAVGLYGVLAYAVARRAKEIGIRMALGAVRGEVLWMVIRHALILLGAGIAIGIPVALGASRFVSSMLFGVKGTDPWTIAAASAVLTAAALVAALLPAWRASRVDPIVALRYE